MLGQRVPGKLRVSAGCSVCGVVFELEWDTEFIRDSWARLRTDQLDKTVLHSAATIRYYAMKCCGEEVEEN